jgi:hypothetical protein
MGCLVSGSISVLGPKAVDPVLGSGFGQTFRNGSGLYVRPVVSMGRIKSQQRRATQMTSALCPFRGTLVLVDGAWTAH